jgi:hypothetical protein
MAKWTRAMDRQVIEFGFDAIGSADKFVTPYRVRLYELRRQLRRLKLEAARRLSPSRRAAVDSQLAALAAQTLIVGEALKREPIAIDPDHMEDLWEAIADILGATAGLRARGAPWDAGLIPNDASASTASGVRPRLLRRENRVPYR